MERRKFDTAGWSAEIRAPCRFLEGFDAGSPTAASNLLASMAIVATVDSA
jgi:hypothetical protein